MDISELTNKIRRGEIDYNNQSRFFGLVIKGLLWKLRQDIQIRGMVVPHYIVNTGDDVMYLENKGQDISKEPFEVTNEDYIYTIVPRCAVSPKGISLQPDQLSSPYSNGISQYDDEENVISFTSEFRRMPLKMTFDLQYVIDSYTDTLELIQQIVTKLAFVQTYTITYMGQSITCSYNIPESLDGELAVDFDEATTDDRRRKLNINVDVETNLPIFDTKTIIPASKYIQTTVWEYDINKQDVQKKIIEDAIRTLYITKNGSYNTDDCDKISVNVTSPTQTKTITLSENGAYTITPDEGYLLNSADVTVKVPSTPAQWKGVKYDSDGDYVVTPDPGYVMDKVLINIDAEPSWDAE